MVKINRPPTKPRPNINPAPQKPGRVEPPTPWPRPPATGATTCLERHCRECGDVLPDGAWFCITCGESVK